MEMTALRGVITSYSIHYTKLYDEFLYWEIMEGRNALSFRQAARMGDWKGVRYGAGARTQLFDLRSDPYETMSYNFV